MTNFLTLLVALHCVAHLAAGNYTESIDCGEEESSTHSMSLHIVSKRNRTGQWTTTFSTSKSELTVNEPSNTTLDVLHSVTECKGRRMVTISGVIVDESPDLRLEGVVLEKLIFHSKCGSNVAVINKGLTVQKINLDESQNSVAFTNRPLRNNELFEVRLDKKLNKYPHCLAIGITTNSPLEISIPDHINNVAHPIWTMYHSNAYQNGSLKLNKYGKDLDTLVVGDRVGVMKTDTGSLHFYINGVDQGPAASNVPFSVYGLLELYANAAMATIVNPS